MEAQKEPHWMVQVGSGSPPLDPHDPGLRSRAPRREGDVVREADFADHPLRVLRLRR